MKQIKQLMIIICIICVFLPTAALACPGGDEFGRPYFEVWNRDWTTKTMFYSLDQHFYRRELCTITYEHSSRESFSFPIVGQSVLPMYGYRNWGEINYPSSVSVSGTDFLMFVGLTNTFRQLRAIAENNEADEVFYDILVHRLHATDGTDDNFFRAQSRFDDGGFTQALPQILRIEAGIIFEDMVFTEMQDDITALDSLHDTIEVFVQKHEGIDVNNVVAINLDRELHEIDRIPLSLPRDDTIRFVIYESGTYAFVLNDFADFLSPESLYEQDPVEILYEYEYNQETPDAANISGVVAILIALVVVVGIIALLMKKKQPKKRSRKH